MKQENTAFTQKNLFRIIGLSRSGNHAIINWILQQLEGQYCFLNCTEPKYNPFLTSRPLGEDFKTYLTNIPEFNITQERQGIFSTKDYLLYSHEDCFLGSLNGRSQKENEEEWIGSSQMKRDILILRDPYNLFASRIKSGLLGGHYTHHGAKPISVKTLRRIYVQHAREFLQARRKLRNPVLINFNKWSTDKMYREQLCHSLEIPFTDQGFLEVKETAGGSSFDGTRFSGKAERMDLQNRWRNFVDQDAYRMLFTDELHELSAEIFGEVVPLDQWHKYEEALTA